MRQKVVGATTSEEGHRPRGRRSLRRRIRHALRPRVTRSLVWLAVRVVPPLCLLYMRLVFLTSRVEDHGLGRLREILDRYGGAVGLLWHEEIPIAVYGYPHMGFRVSTLASYSDAGEVIARVLKRLRYVVFRGGSSYRESRKNGAVLNDMIEHMRTGKKVFYGLTVDGSQGPAYRVKSGGVVIARECGKPVVLLRTWHKRCLRLGGWDRMAVPLPFNVISFYAQGPYFVPDSAQTDEGLRRFVAGLEEDLIDLTVHSYDRFLQPRPEPLRDPTGPSRHR